MVEIIKFGDKIALFWTSKLLKKIGTVPKENI